MLLGIGLLLAAVPAGAQRDARVLHRNLSELVGDAHVILLGQVTSVKAETHPQFQNIQTVVVTLDVAEVWKGQAGKTYTFRLFVNHPLDQKEKLGYGDGQDVLLMLTKPSDIGLSSPAGLEQGRFRVTSDAAGNKQVTNGLDNAGLLARMDKTAPKLSAQVSHTHTRQVLSTHRSGPIALDDFKRLVQALVANPD
jgi:hypothetical protein